MNMKPCPPGSDGLQQTAYGRDACPSPTKWNHGAPSSGGLLFFSSQWGLLTNCLMQINLARWLAEQFGKTLVMPMCISSENPEHTCTVRKNVPNQRLRYVHVNMSAIWTARSLGGCAVPREAVELHSVAHRHARESTRLTCIGLRPDECASEIARDAQFNGTVLARNVQSYPLHLALRWLQRQPVSAAPHEVSWARARADAEHSSCQQAHDPCSRCVRTLSAQDQYRSRGGSYVSAPNGQAVGFLTEKCLANSTCPRRCAEALVAPLDNVLQMEGDVFVTGWTLFQISMQMPNIFRICEPPQLQPWARREMLQVVEAMKMADGRHRPFVCVHWRGGDFLANSNPQKQARNNHLYNGSVMAAITASVARAVGVADALVLTNARVERQLEMRRAARAAGLRLTMRACTDVPPDVEKHACAERSSALVLTASSTFSEHIQSMAPSGTPYVYVGKCEGLFMSVRGCLSRSIHQRDKVQCRVGRAGEQRCSKMWFRPPAL